MLLILALLILVPGILIALLAPDKHPEDFPDEDDDDEDEDGGFDY